MSPFRKLLFVGVGVLALHGVQACASETELNPQPLPPQGGESTNPPNPEDKTGVTGSSGSSGGGDVPAASPSDGGTDGDADADADGGDAGVH